ncbi:unnamed protein product [Boreogadus saida]
MEVSSARPASTLSSALQAHAAPRDLLKKDVFEARVRKPQENLCWGKFSISKEVQSAVSRASAREYLPGVVLR